MVKKSRGKRKRPQLAPTAERVTWLLDHVWNGNRSAMARDVSCSPSVITKIAAGSQSPGRRLLTAISAHPKINPSWLFSGAGEPLLAEAPEVPAAGWPVPITRYALPGEPAAYQDLLTGESFPTSGAFYRPSRYWLEIHANEPLLRLPHLKLKTRDLLLIESDARWWEEMRFVHARICVVEAEDGQVRLAYVHYDEANPDDPGESLWMEAPLELDGVRREVRLWWKEDGSLDARECPVEPGLRPQRRVSLAQIRGLSVMLLRR